MGKILTICQIKLIVIYNNFSCRKEETPIKKSSVYHFSSVTGDKDRYSFPPEMPIIHAEFTYFYYPGDFIFPRKFTWEGRILSKYSSYITVPPSKVFVYANPVQINFDLSSVIWFNSFALNLHESLLRTSVVTKTNSAVPSKSSSLASSSSVSEEPSLLYMDVKVEAIMPRIIIESSVDVSNQRDRPRTMQIQISRFTTTNIREMGSSRADLAQALQSLQEGSLVFGSGFPSACGDMCIVTDRILSHVAGGFSAENTAYFIVFSPPILQAFKILCYQMIFYCRYIYHTFAASDVTPMSQDDLTISSFSRYAMWAEPRDVWCMKLDPVWIEFLGAKSLGQGKTIPFVDAVPITLWIHGKPETVRTESI